ncbi:MAG: SLOG family protein [Rikenellaceae bacterium]
MILEATESVAFTGNRAMHVCKDLCIEDINREVRVIVASHISRLYADGFRTFLSGGAVGFDLLAAEEVIAARDNCPEIKLCLVVPFEGQEAKYPQQDEQRYLAIKDAANKVITICEGEYSVSSYHLRNDFLISNSSYIIAYSDGEGRGTLSTIKKAIKAGKRVVNIYDELCGRDKIEQLSFVF